MRNFYTNNLEFFKKSAPDLYIKCIEAQPVFNVDVQLLEEQFNYLAEFHQTRCFVHSIYDTGNEMIQMFCEVNDKTETLVLYGFGCGYAAEHIVSDFPAIKNVILIEPNLKLFREVLKHFSFEKFLSKLQTVSIVLNEDAGSCRNIVSGLIQKFWDNDIAFAYHVSYRSLFPGYYENIIKYVAAEMNRKKINLGTQDYHMFRYAYDTIKNLEHPFVPIEQLLKRLRGIPVIIVSAGPSLNQQIPLLRGVQDKALICAVGTAMNVLDRHGVRPHLRFAFDANKAQMEIFEGLSNPVGLVYGSSLYYEALLSYMGPKIRFITDLDFLTQYVYNKAGIPFTAVRSGFSIANTAFDIACRLEGSPVVLIGQDLCYQNGELYADGLKKGPELDCDNPGFVKALNNQGETVYTINTFLGMKRTFEKLIQQYPNIQVINATDKGVLIEGADYRTFEEVLAVLPENVQISKILDTLYTDFESGHYHSEWQKIVNVLAEMAKEVDAVLTVNAERLEILKKAEKILSKGGKLKRVQTDIKYAQSLELRLEVIPFYILAVRPTLVGLMESIEQSNKYVGNDSAGQISAEIRTMLGKTTRVFQYAEFIKQCLEEIIPPEVQYV